jgi:hypothetical protein
LAEKSPGFVGLHLSTWDVFLGMETASWIGFLHGNYEKNIWKWMTLHMKNHDFWCWTHH